MKVKCILLLGHDGREVNSSSWLAVGAIYHVLSIFIDPSGTRSYSIVTSEPTNEWAIIGSFPAECFEVVSTVIPSNWRIWIQKDSSIGISPLTWQEPWFAEALFEHDPAARIVFDTERHVILGEDP